MGEPAGPRGWVFMTSADTDRECLQKCLAGMPASRKATAARIKAGDVIFLYNTASRLFHGVFEASCDGGYKLDSTAFGGAYPAQVRFSVALKCPDQSLAAVKHVLVLDKKGHFSQELEPAAAKNLRAIFERAAGKPATTQRAAASAAHAPAPGAGPGPRTPPPAGGGGNPVSNGSHPPPQQAQRAAAPASADAPAPQAVSMAVLMPWLAVDDGPHTEAPHAAAAPPPPPAAPPVSAAPTVIKECVICMEMCHVSDMIALVPCGHRCICLLCSQVNILPGSNCPKCRQQTMFGMRIWDD